MTHPPKLVRILARTGVQWRLQLACALSGVAVAIAMAACSGSAQATGVAAERESAVKAAFLIQFAGFVEWPGDAFQRALDPLVIGIVGDDAVFADLEQLAKGRSVNGRPLAVRRWREAPDREGEPVHILFVGSGNDARLRELVARTPGPVLVVAQLDGALASGAALNFVLEQGRVRFDAAPKIAEARGLKLSSRLLAVARGVESRSP